MDTAKAAAEAKVELPSCPATNRDDGADNSSARVPEPSALASQSAGAFAALDRDADGLLSPKELRVFIERMVDPSALLRSLKVKSIDEASDALLKSLDIDGDQLIRRARAVASAAAAACSRA